MTPEKRNEIMDSLWETYRIAEKKTKHGSIVVNGSEMAAIREIDRRSRAWDELRTRLRTKYGAVTAAEKEMDSLIPPEPADKLERLTSWLRDIGACESPDEIVRASALFKKIKELQDEDR